MSPDRLVAGLDDLPWELIIFGAIALFNFVRSALAKHRGDQDDAGAEEDAPRRAEPAEPEPGEAEPTPEPSGEPEPASAYGEADAPEREPPSWLPEPPEPEREPPSWLPEPPAREGPSWLSEAPPEPELAPAPAPRRRPAPPPRASEERTSTEATDAVLLQLLLEPPKGRRHPAFAAGPRATWRRRRLSTLREGTTASR